jgi:hypothetical protein
MHLLTAKKCIKIYQIILMYIFRYNCDVEMIVIWMVVQVRIKTEEVGFLKIEDQTL